MLLPVFFSLASSAQVEHSACVPVCGTDPACTFEPSVVAHTQAAVVVVALWWWAGMLGLGPPHWPLSASFVVAEVANLLLQGDDEALRCRSLMRQQHAAMLLRVLVLPQHTASRTSGAVGGGAWVKRHGRAAWHSHVSILENYCSCQIMFSHWCHHERLSLSRKAVKALVTDEAFLAFARR